jgi:hypothetical protein
LVTLFRIFQLHGSAKKDLIALKRNLLPTFLSLEIVYFFRHHVNSTKNRTVDNECTPLHLAAAQRERTPGEGAGGFDSQ